MKSLTPLFIALSILAGTVVSANSLIIGGTPVLQNEHLAVFGIKTSRPATEENMEALCTRFLVHPKLILTAAHCLLVSTSVDLTANGTNIDRSKSQGTKGEATHFKSNPTYQNPDPKTTQGERKKSASSDIGYIILRNPMTITPLPIYVSDSREAMGKLLNKEITLVGYGATEFRSSGDYERSKLFVKHKGTKKITGINPDYLILEGEMNGALPGDSGGPEIADVDGKTLVVALNHSLNNARKKVQVTQKVPDPNRPGKKIKVTVEEDVADPTHYGSTIGTLLTTENLCWVEKDSGIEISGVECK